MKQLASFLCFLSSFLLIIAAVVTLVYRKPELACLGWLVSCGVLHLGKWLDHTLTTRG